MGAVTSALYILAYAVSCKLPGTLARFRPAASFTLFLLSAKFNMGAFPAYGAALALAALGFKLYTERYGVPTRPTADQIAAGWGSRPLVEPTPQLVRDYVYSPGVAGLASLVAATSLELAGLGPRFIPSTWHPSLFIILAHTARTGAFLIERMIFPAPIVAQFMIGEPMLGRLRAPLAPYIRRVPVRSSDGDPTASVLGTVEYAAIPYGSLGRLEVKTAVVPNSPWLVYCGGNGEVFEASYPSAVSLCSHLRANLVVFNPRGVGNSTGDIFSAADLVLDAKSVINAVIKEHNLQPDGRKIVLFGHSIGGGVAAELAATALPQASLVLDRTFSSLVDAANALSPLKHEGLVRAIVPLAFGDFDNVGNFNKVAHERKVILYHREDQILPYAKCSMARLGLAKLGGSWSAVIELQGRTNDNHNSGLDRFSNFDMVLKRIASYLQ